MRLPQPGSRNPIRAFTCSEGAPAHVWSRPSLGVTTFSDEAARCLASGGLLCVLQSQVGIRCVEVDIESTLGAIRAMLRFRVTLSLEKAKG